MQSKEISGFWGNLVSKLRPYRGVLKAGFSNAVEYRTNFFIETIAWLLVSASVNIYLWYAVFDSPTSRGIATEQGFITLRQIFVYIAFATISASLCRKGRMERATGEEIRSGELNKYLIKPVSHIGYIMAASGAERLIALQLTSVFVLMLGVPLVAYFDIEISWIGFLCALPMIICGMLIHSLLALMLSYLAFWLDEVWTFHVVKDISLGFLSGQLLPLTTLPASFYHISSLLPFQYIAFVPAAFVSGILPASSFVAYFAGAIAWVVILFVITLSIWKRGIKRYSAFGG